MKRKSYVILGLVTVLSLLFITQIDSFATTRNGIPIDDDVDAKKFDQQPKHINELKSKTQCEGDDLPGWKNELKRSYFYVFIESIFKRIDDKLRPIVLPQKRVVPKRVNVYQAVE